MIREHDHEPVPGIPGRLPAGETLLWQGAPAWRDLARRVFHVREIAAYFGIVAAWMVVSTLYDGGGAGKAATAAAVTLVIGVIPILLFGLYAWAIQKTTVYSITSRRVIIRAGVALPMAVNLPFALIEGASAQARPDGSGDVALNLRGPNQPSYALLWPHARPWRFRRPEPLLRALPDLDGAAAILTRALETIRVQRVEPNTTEAAPVAVAAE